MKDLNDRVINILVGVTLIPISIFYILKRKLKMDK